MKQALTTGGQLSVWFASAQAALEKMGVIDLINDIEKPGLSGQHPEFGPIEIVFLVPEEGKTRMEIAVTDGQLITEFKQAVIPEYKKLLKAIAEGAVLPTEQDQQQEEADAPTESLQETAEEPQETDAAQEETAAADAAEQEDTVQQETTVPQQPPIESWGFPESEGNEIIPEEPASQNDTAVPDKKKMNPKKKIGIIVAGVLVLALIAGALIYFFAVKSNQKEDPHKEPVDPQQEEQLITLDQFNQIENGMTYEQVCAVFNNKPGTELSSTSYADSSGENVDLKIYYWEAKGESGANASISFQDGVVITKSSYGLQQPTGN